MDDIWILGATGRSGRAAAAHLAATGLSPVLVGRDAGRLAQTAAAIGRDLPIRALASVADIAREIARDRPAMVVNTIGPFTQSALPIATACLAGRAHYVDLSNEVFSFIDLFAVHDRAVAAGVTLVNGAGFGVLGTEAVVLKLCEGQPPAAKVRVDALPHIITTEPDRIGDALAATMVDNVTLGGRRYADGKLVRSPVFADFERLTLPGGASAHTASVPTGDLEAAHRASGAPFAVAGSSMAPASPLIRALVPAALSLFRIRALRDFVRPRIAAIEIRPPDPEKARPLAPGLEFSWGHARVEWASDEVREGWLRVDDAIAFTNHVLVEVAGRLARGEGRPGVYTPGALFGADLAVEAGGEFVL